jgi:hypothetical protein
MVHKLECYDLFIGYMTIGYGGTCQKIKAKHMPPCQAKSGKRNFFRRPQLFPNG